MKVSVLIVTYNSKLKDIIRTLETVLMQDFSGYEIIIADDGSNENHFECLRHYFSMKSFSDYKLVENKENQGTVKNVLSGLYKASGKYTKCFGPGDGFYDKQSLNKYFDFLEKTGHDACFAYMQGYTRDYNGKLEKRFYGFPRDIRAYQSENDKTIAANLVLYSDNICGASMFCRTEYYREYLDRIKNFVKYEEDIFQVLAAVENNRFYLLQDYTIWYEMESGISTAKKSPYTRLLEKDMISFYDNLNILHGDNVLVQKRSRLSGLYKRVGNIYVKTILRSFVNPGAIIFVFKYYIQRMQRRRTICSSVGFFENNEFERKIVEIIEHMVGEVNAGN